MAASIGSFAAQALPLATIEAPTGIAQLALLDEIPGVDQPLAAVIIAELGLDMTCASSTVGRAAPVSPPSDQEKLLLRLFSEGKGFTEGC